MNARERYIKSCLGGKVDRFFRFEIGAWPSTIGRWKTEGLPAYVSSQEKLNEQFYAITQENKSCGCDGNQKAEEEISFNDYFKHDPLLRMPIKSGFCDSPLFPKFEEIILEEEDHTLKIRDVDGVIKRILKTNADLSMPQFLEFPVKDRKDWEMVKKNHLDPSNVEKHLGDLASISNSISEDRDYPVFMTLCGAFGHPRNLLGDENLCYMLYDDPELFVDIIDNWFDMNKEIIRLASKNVNIDSILIWEDMSYKNGPLISPEHFERFLSPNYAKLIDYAKSCGIKAAWVDTDGDCRKLIPLFIKAGVDAIMPFEVQAGMNIVDIRKQFGDTFTIVGGINKRVLATDFAAIKKEVDSKLPYFIESGRYIPCLDHTVPADVSLVNYQYYLECIRSYE